MAHQANTESAQHVEKLKELVKDIEVSMLTSVHDDGSLRSRPMMLQQIDDNGHLWFFTNRDGQKFDAISHHAEVNVSFSEPAKEKFVSISGHAELLNDSGKIAELWSPVAKSWFPEGMDDPNLALLRIDMTGAEYWDIKSGLMVILTGYVRATFTGRPQSRQGQGIFSESQKIAQEELQATSIH